ncbi:MAG: protocatechuate 3,4-dioxygenase beta subunit, partial [Planctomycetota bacterium]
ATAPGDSDEIFDPVTMEDVEQAQRNVVETAEVEAPEQVTTEDRPGPQQPVASLSGRCINGQGVALDGVKILDRDKRTVARSSDDGSFRFDVDLQDRQSLTRRFSFEREGSGRRELQVTLRAGQETSCGDVILALGGRIFGRVVDLDGRGLEGVSIRVEEVTGNSHSSRFYGPGNPIAKTTSLADGTYALEDVAPCDLRLWAGGGTWVWDTTEILELAPGGDVNAGDLEVLLLEPKDTIELTVVDPDGEPIPQANVSYAYDISGQSGSGSSTTNNQGRLRHFTDPRAPFTFRASDPAGRYRPVTAIDVEPGTHDLVMRLGKKEVIQLLVKDETGDPVEAFSVMLQTGGDSLGSSFKPPGDGTLAIGVVEIMLPEEFFSLTVSAPGHRLEVLDNLDPATVARELEVELHALPGIHGRVLADGKPIAGAKVSLHEVVGSTGRVSVNGFPCVTKQSQEARATTDEEGRYSLTLRESGEWVVRAMATNYAPGETPAQVYAQDIGAQGLDIEMTTGGSIVGHILVLGGEEVSGRIVGFSRGDGFGFTMRTDANGEYRAEGLTPGNWQVVQRQEEVRTNFTNSSYSSGTDALVIPWNCRVFAGEETRFDLDLRDLAMVTLAGSFGIEGASTRGWRVSMSAIDDQALETVYKDVLDVDGSFRLTANEPGNYRVSITGELFDTYFHANRNVALGERENELVTTMKSGTIRGHVPPAQFDEQAEIYITSVSNEGWTINSGIRPNGEGEFTLEHFPAGPATIHYRTSDGVSGTKDITVPEVGAIDVYLP